MDTTSEGDWVMVGSAGMMNTAPSSRVTRVIGPDASVTEKVITGVVTVVAIVAGGAPGAVVAGGVPGAVVLGTVACAVVVPVAGSWPSRETDDAVALSPIAAGVYFSGGNVANGNVDSDEPTGAAAEHPAMATAEPSNATAATTPNTPRGKNIVIHTPGK